ncbi:hypothetical protein HDU82_006122 [Entophlyctis luteolus]|nr:hypothetical protein HDU82_006122 [Entophlyctis luteolus]
MHAHPQHHGFALHAHKHAGGSEWCAGSADATTGYFETPRGFFFFALFDSRANPDSDPFVLWINVCALPVPLVVPLTAASRARRVAPDAHRTLVGLFMELGPCRVDAGGNSTSFNPHAWNNQANLLFLDQPVGVGFSYAKPNAIVGNSETAAAEVDIFFQILMHNFPKYANSSVQLSCLPTFSGLFGESYAGHYIPAIGRRILRENKSAPVKNPNRAIIKLESLGIGNGWVRPLVQFKYFADYLVDEKYGPFISPSEYKSMKQNYEVCAFFNLQCERYSSPLTCIPAYEYCERAFEFPKHIKRNPYDVRQACDEEVESCYPIDDDIETYLNQPWVQSAIGVDIKYQGCSSVVDRWFLWGGDNERRYDDAVAEALHSGVRVLVYAGDADFVCNWIGNEAWLKSMDWRGAAGFLHAPMKDFIVGNDNIAGTFKTFANLTWLVLHGAGHMVPYDKPAESLEMLMNWIL